MTWKNSDVKEWIPSLDYIEGDVNGDGSISMSDISMVISYYLAVDKPSDFNFAAADVNGDGYVSMSDASMISNMYLRGVNIAEYQIFTEKLNIKDNQNVTRGYRYVYNDANRLRGAIYSEERTDGTTPTQTPNYGAAFLYDANGNIGHIYRYGKMQNSEYGYVDNIVLSYTGNQLTSVKEKANSVTAERSTDYKGEKDVQTSCTYNGVGSLTSDEGRNIALIEYDNMNNPSRIQFTNGNVTKYVYSATGEKLRTIHQTAAPNITVAVGTAHELTASELLYTDSTDYYCGGKLTMKNGRMDKYFFDGGYAQATVDEANNSDNFAFFHYNSDHLGNIREVIDEKGDVVQITNYYPFGTPYSAEDCATHNPDQQNHKYNGKEFDSTHGLNTYDYGARQYNSLVGRWDRMDPLCEKYYSVSPYAYCANNPISFVDVNGCDSVYYQECGNELLRIPSQGSYNFVIKTTQTTKQMYAESSKDQKGKSNPISSQAAYETAVKIASGDVYGPHMNNVTQLGSDEEMSAMLNSIKDDGTGGTSSKNNREYSGNFALNGVHANKPGRVGNPASGVYVTTNGNPDYHSHPSGRVVSGNKIYCWQQPPSRQDISTAHHKQFVVGAGNGIIYVYNRKGVFATIPTSIFR